MHYLRTNVADKNCRSLPFFCYPVNPLTVRWGDYALSSHSVAGSMHRRLPDERFRLRFTANPPPKGGGLTISKLKHSVNNAFPRLKSEIFEL